VFSPLAVPCQQLEHSAARDRISVKNKRRQPLKQKVRDLFYIRFSISIFDFLVEHTSRSWRWFISFEDRR